ncbi:nucleolin-like isoform X3 [Eschrichtius robustus]|uniref:nucleolin-like isoform X3 n=1 Tax=Eschrichtius robustus TaxID=9764 RepID=UPI0035C2124B
MAVEVEATPVNTEFCLESRKTNQGELKKMSLSPEEIEDGEDETSEDKDNGSRDEVDVPQKNGRKITTAPGNKIEKKKFLAPMFAEKFISPCRKGATGAKLPKDRRSAMLENHEKRHENPEEDEEPMKKAPDKQKEEMIKQKASPETKNQKLEDGNAKTLLIKNLPDRVTQHELIEVFEDTFQIRLVSKDGMSERIASIDFKSQADAERALEEKQGTEIGGLAVVLNLVRAKIQGQDERDRKKCNWRTQEGVDGNNDPHIGVFIRGGNETFDVTEDLLDMVPITGTTSENELVLHVEKSLKTFNVDWSKLVSISTDGDSAMVGVKELVAKLKSKVSGLGFPGGTVVKNPPADAGDTGSSPGPGRSHVPWSN